MGLFDFLKKKEEKCSCGGQCGVETVENARFIVLGACCKKSLETFENTKKAVAEMGFSDLVINIGDMEQIAKYGVMATPALVVDNNVVSYGKFLTVDEVKKIIGGL
jgi:small redox-active disulfide protein 2